MQKSDTRGVVMATSLVLILVMGKPNERSKGAELTEPPFQSKPCPAQRSDCNRHRSLPSSRTFRHCTRYHVWTRQRQNKNQVSRSSKAGLQFPVGRIARYIKKGKFATRFGAGASVYLLGTSLHRSAANVVWLLSCRRARFFHNNCIL